MNRRLFLSSVAAAGAAVGLGPVSRAEPMALASTKSTELASGAPLTGAAASALVLSRRLFADTLQERFTVSSDTSRHLELVELHDGPTAAGLDQFSLVFRDVDESTRTLRAGMHTLSHSTHGELNLYLEPAADDARGVCYRASLCLLS